MAISNIKKVFAPYVEIELPVDTNEDGALKMDTFKLAYDFNAVCLIKQQTGKSIIDTRAWDNIEDDPETLSAILWGGLQLYQNLPLEQVRAMMLGCNWMALLDKIVEAWKAVKPKAKAATTPTQEPTAEPALAQEKN